MTNKKTFVLLGGGFLLLKIAKFLRFECNIKPIVFCSKRHLIEKIGNNSFVEHLKTDRFDFHEINKLEVNSLKKLPIKYSNAIAFSFGAPWIIKQDFINLFNNNIYNFHGAKLPQNRGGGGFSWQILRELNYGMCLVHRIDTGIDTGEIIQYEEFLYESCKKPEDYMEMYINKNTLFIQNFIKKILSDLPPHPVKQSEYFSSYWPRLNTEKHAWINWNWTGLDIYKFICAFDSPYVGAHTFLNGVKVYLKDAFWDTNDGNFHPFQAGIIYRYTDEYYAIATKGGTLIIKSISDENQRKILIQHGDRLHTPHEYLEKALEERVIYTPAGIKQKK